MSDSADTEQPKRPDADEMPDTEAMEEPSAEKEAGQEPKAPARAEPEPSHEAVGIGVIGRPQVEPDADTDPEE